MEVFSILEEVTYSDDKPIVKTFYKSDDVNEMRISFTKNQKMKAHKAPFKIIVSVLEGKINFGVDGQNIILDKGYTIPVEANITHDLLALEQSIVRVTLIKK